MDKTQEEIYLFLFRVWKNEATSSIIGKIEDNNTFLKELQILIAKIKESIEKCDKQQKVVKKVHEQTLKNIRYMIKDFFNIRSEKILNLCKSLTKIDEELLFPVELDYYKQLYSAFKGDSNTKKFLLANFENNNFSAENIEQKSKPDNSSNLKEENVSPKNNKNEFPRIEKKEKTTNITSDVEQNVIEEFNVSPRSKEIQYVLIRLTKNIPALVGKDLKIYGPFQKEDIARIPFQNAAILIEENAAIKINSEY